MRGRERKESEIFSWPFWSAIVLLCKGTEVYVVDSTGYIVILHVMLHCNLYYSTSHRITSRNPPTLRSLVTTVGHVPLSPLPTQSFLKLACHVTIHPPLHDGARCKWVNKQLHGHVPSLQLLVSLLYTRWNLPFQLFSSFLLQVSILW